MPFTYLLTVALSRSLCCVFSHENEIIWVKKIAKNIKIEPCLFEFSLKRNTHSLTWDGNVKIFVVDLIIVLSDIIKQNY